MKPMDNLLSWTRKGLDMVAVKWEVQPAPVGRYKSFRRRGWPNGHSPCNMFFSIQCKDDYIPHKVKSGEHAVLKLSIRDDSIRSSKFRTFFKEFANITELKEFVKKLDCEKLRKQE